MNRSTPGVPVHHQLPEFTQTHVHQVSDAIQPSHPLWSPSPPALNPVDTFSSGQIILQKKQLQMCTQMWLCISLTGFELVLFTLTFYNRIKALRAGHWVDRREQISTESLITITVRTVAKIPVGSHRRSERGGSSSTKGWFTHSAEIFPEVEGDFIPGETSSC